jgi:hypothetical protein
MLTFITLALVKISFKSGNPKNMVFHNGYAKAPCQHFIISLFVFLITYKWAKEASVGAWQAFPAYCNACNAGAYQGHTWGRDLAFPTNITLG